ILSFFRFLYKMYCQLPTDCLYKIFELLENDVADLYSCLLVNRSWCEVAVEILWRNVGNWNFQSSSSKVLNTLFICLSDESKKLLHKKKILNSISKLPLFNYVSFCKVL